MLVRRFLGSSQSSPRSELNSVVLLFSWTRPLTQTWSLLLEGPEKFSHPESRSNILNLMIKYYKAVFIFIFLIGIEVPFIQDVSYTPLCL